MMEKQTVWLAYCHPGWVRAEFMESLIRLQQPPNVTIELLGRQGGPMVAIGRNALVQKFLDLSQTQGDHWLWMVDTDVTFSPDVLARSLEAADKETRPILSGLYFGVQSLVIPEIQEDEITSVVPILFEGDETDVRLWLDYPRDQLVEVAATGAGCLLVHRSVLAALGGGWFDLSLNGHEFGGEDAAFCMRARSHGFPIYAHTGIKLGHIKTVRLDEDLYDAAMELSAVSTSEGRWNR